MCDIPGKNCVVRNSKEQFIMLNGLAYQRFQYTGPTQSKFDEQQSYKTTIRITLNLSCELKVRSFTGLLNENLMTTHSGVIIIGSLIITNLSLRTAR
jgi:hypothetical protein